ncbi:MAG TPA: hypothetical protein VMX17_13360 [Candidatus Glassbacteria bacterium]|nr:hypothetical protein [Candidatus Glassbacteria bacterium]
MNLIKIINVFYKKANLSNDLEADMTFEDAMMVLGLKPDFTKEEFEEAIAPKKNDVVDFQEAALRRAAKAVITNALATQQYADEAIGSFLEDEDDDDEDEAEDEAEDDEDEKPDLKLVKNYDNYIFALKFHHRQNGFSFSDVTYFDDGFHMADVLYRMSKTQGKKRNGAIIYLAKKESPNTLVRLGTFMKDDETNKWEFVSGGKVSEKYLNVPIGTVTDIMEFVNILKNAKVNTLNGGLLF